MDFITADQLMEVPDGVTTLLNQAKYEFDHGCFTTLRQADFFNNMLALIAAPPPVEPPAPPPEP